jgi:hypothetical protein
MRQPAALTGKENLTIVSNEIENSLYESKECLTFEELQNEQSM